MTARGAVLVADPKAGTLSVRGTLPIWATRCLEAHHDHLVYWWRHSPCALLACERCGEWKLTGSRQRDGAWCNRGTRGRSRGMTFESGCQGKYRLVELPWSTNRPRRRRKKLT